MTSEAVKPDIETVISAIENMRQLVDSRSVRFTMVDHRAGIDG